LADLVKYKIIRSDFFGGLNNLAILNIYKCWQIQKPSLFILFNSDTRVQYLLFKCAFPLNSKENIIIHELIK